MAAYAESKASFAHRAQEIGLTQVQVSSLELQQIKTFNNLAFAVCAQPGQIDDARFRNLVDSAFVTVTLGLESMMRQLCYEAITVAVAAIKQRVDPSTEGQVKKLPPQERDDRIRKQNARITGFTIRGDYEPAHCIVDFFATMIDESAPKYLPLSKCISREQELQSQRTDKSVVIVEDKQLHVKNRGSEQTADLSSDLKVQNAFIRRGLACEQANLMTYETHEKIRHAFMAHMTRDPPPNFKGPDLGAILRADRELWMRSFEICKSNLKIGPDDKYPLDVAMLQLYTSPEVVFHLLPTPGNSSSSSSKQTKKRSRSSSSKSKPGRKPKAGKPKHNAPSKNKQNTRVKVPAQLQNYSGVNSKKMRVCYNYNLPHGCSNQTHKKDGDVRCVKGVHQCIKCFKPHPLGECGKSDS